MGTQIGLKEVQTDENNKAITRMSTPSLFCNSKTNTDNLIKCTQTEKGLKKRYKVTTS